VADVTSDEAYRNGDPLRMRTAKLLGARTAMWLPLLKGEAVIGALAIYRQEVKPFTDEQIALVQTFADQAVIAIENVRLFNETKEALEQQTAISEVLRVISGSPTDVKPVLEAVAMRAAKICDATDARIMLVEAGGTMLRHAAGFGDFPPKVDLFPLNRDTSAGRAIIDGAPFQIPDIAAAPADEYKLGRELAAKAGWRTAMSVPLMREDRALGAIALRRREARPFSEKQISLLKVFADQAAIAIENVRLFNETKESLERQTATADILRVISSSPTDIQPVMRAVAQSAARLCDATDVIIRRVEGEVMPAVEHIGAIPLGEAAMAPRINKNTINGRAILECRSIHITDVMAPDVSAEYPEGLFLQNPGSFRSILVVPMRREGRAIGSIIVRHAKVRPFSDQQIKLLETFADQAVIAIENVRLFNELGARNRDLGESLEQQTATADILRVISSSPTDLKPVLDAVAQRSAQLCNASDAAIFNVEGETLRRVAHFGSIPFTSAGALRKVTLGTVAGRSVIERRTIHEHDILQAHARGEYPEGPALQRPVGYRTVLVAPLLREGAAIGAIVIRRMEVNPFSDKQIKLLETFADQAVIAIENVRLFREIQEKSAQLEVANKHKSDFLANMSHELRTPLNAIIGFSEVLIDKMFGEVNAKQLDYLKDIHESGRHLLSLINDILDLSKIEAGRMELELCSFHLPSAISNAMTLVRERAQRHGIQLGAEIDERLGELQADERKFKQIMLNLLSNAVKFTPDGGRVDVSAKRDTTRVEIAVRDTGVGIAPADQAALFEEFKQVGRDGARKAEGTGLGLALTKRFVELHGGEIRVQSAPGKGSTFTVSLPIR
jgi:signal transduction histidine kinase